VLHALKKTILQIWSLDLLSPELLRSQTKVSNGKLGLGGERLSAFIHESGKEGKDKLQQLLSKVYTQLEKVDTRSLRAGWKQLEITEKFGEQTLKSTARHMNDGMLRLMAVLTQLESENEILLFDEIENGINPELIEYLIDQLVQAPHQILVTTHSPMILNFLEDDIAAEGVVYLYKNNQGYTQSIKLFDIPSMAKKLEFMGPGEVFVDTDLTNLYQEIDSMNTSQ
jgi:predicted ATPase